MVEGAKVPVHALEESEEEYESADDRTPGKSDGGRRSHSAEEAGEASAEGNRQNDGDALPRGGLENELLRFKSHTGMEVAVEKRYTIRDLSTGQVFVLDGDDGLPPGAASAAERPISPSRVMDASSGRALSLEEFDRALGLHTALEVAKRFHQGDSMRRASGTEPNVNGTDSLSREGSGAEPAAEPAAAEGKKAGGKAWFRDKFNAAKERLASVTGRSSSDTGNESDDSSVSHSDASKLSMQHDSLSDRGSGASPTGNLGQPVKVHVHRKLYKELTELSLIQELHAHTGVVWTMKFSKNVRYLAHWRPGLVHLCVGGVVWTMKFSKNGRYLATGGQDSSICVWEVLLNRGVPEDPSSPTSTTTSNGLPSDDEAPRSGAGASTSGADGCPVFRATPFRTYAAHRQDVLDVSWSGSQFLLSASMDKTVRLWHISMDECLRVFKHPDFVTALDFHPVDDKVFISGAIDGKVRVWSIPEQKVVHWDDCHEMVTAVAFAPSGQRAIVGTMKGKCRFYNVEPGFKLEYEAQIDVKNRRGQQSRGRKVTGMHFLPGDATKLLVTSNDSRIRLYDNYSMRVKYKGYHNRSTQIRATFAPNGAFVISGSDDGWVYIWSTGGSSASQQTCKREKSSSYECFHAHDDIVTVAMFAPETAWRSPKRKGPAFVPKLSGMAEQLNRLGMLSKWSKEEAAHAAAAGEEALAAGRAYGQVIITTGYSGGIKVFENLGQPHWL